MFNVGFDLTNSAHFIRLVRRAFGNTRNSVVLVQPRRGLSDHVENINLSMHLYFNRYRHASTRAGKSPRRALRRRSPLLLLLAFFLFVGSYTIIFETCTTRTALVANLPGGSPCESIETLALLTIIRTTTRVLLASSDSLLAYYAIIALSSDTKVT